MGIGGGIFLIALGAILRFAVNADIEGVSLDVIGNILMVAGIAVAVLSLFFVTVYRDRGVARGERVVERRETSDDLRL
jgi:hypothetical protein